MNTTSNASLARSVGRSGSSTDHRAQSVRIIEKGHTQRDYLSELWSYRALVYHMARSDIRLRYTQTLLGLGWPIVQPLLSMLALTFVFGRVAALDAPANVPYAVLVLSGLVPWQLFATGLTSTSLSVLMMGGLIERVYFPRMVLPIRALTVALHNALISTGLLLMGMLASGVMPSARILLLPLFLAMSALFALALGLFLCVWNARYRDFLHLLPFMLQLAMCVSPVGFESRHIPDGFGWVASINPMASVIDGCRYALLPGEGGFDWLGCGRSLVVVLILLFAGVTFFRRSEASFVERM